MNHVLILTNQIFEDSPILEQLVNSNDKVILYEHPLHFTDFKYHKMKLVMHRATMKYYESYLNKKIKNKIVYIEFTDNFQQEIKKINPDKLHIYNPIDHDIMKELANTAKKLKFELAVYDNPINICKFADYQEYLKQSKNKNPYFHHSFYIWCRQKFNILVKNNKPIGSKWSFDTENRLPFPKNYNNHDKEILDNANHNKYIEEAKKYVNKHFKNNHGSDNYYLPIDFKGAKEHFNIFIKKRLNNFGPYEDAVDKDIIFGNHSVLSPLINIGIITPTYIIKETEKYYNSHNIKIQSVEGYIRQLFWREFCVLVYLFKHDELESNNFFKHKNKLSKSWYDANTPIELLNNIITKALTYGWVHHIERLMYLGNFMLISEIEPYQVYKWFMELFIDAYPWVMSPNVYGMSQHSSGPVMMKRPYFSSSNYIDKMSSYKKKKDIYKKIKINNQEYEWYEIWDIVYYNFIGNNYNYLKNNYSTANIANIWNKKSKDEKNNINKIAKRFFNYL